MPRPLRVEYEGACYHVINRGNYRRNLFGEGGGGAAFERTLGEAAERYGWYVHAYVIMRNHFHLALELTEPNLSEGMKWLQGTWIRRYNAMRKLVGRPFQGRFKALLVEPGHALGQICHYIHLNPVRAGVVAPAEAIGYALGSLPKFVRRRGREGWLEPNTVLAEAGGHMGGAIGGVGARGEGGLGQTRSAEIRRNEGVAGGGDETHDLGVQWMAGGATGYGPAGLGESVCAPLGVGSHGPPVN